VRCRRRCETQAAAGNQIGARCVTTGEGTPALLRALRSKGNPIVHRRIACALVATLTAASLAAHPSSAQATEAEDEAEPVLSLRVAPRIVAYAYGRGPKSRADVPLLAGLRAGAEPVELWSTRASYDEEIRTVWRTAGGDVQLPAGSMDSFGGLDRFLRLTIKNLSTGKTIRPWKDGCLNSYESQRSRPDAPAKTPYPFGCATNPYTLGSVQGIQAGWTSNVLGWQNPLFLRRGKYDVTVKVASRYAEFFGVDPAALTGTTRVIVKKGEDGDGEGRPSARAPRPRAAAPGGPATSDAEALEGPVPNLRSLPAFGISISPNGNNLRFAANVWNAGDSPLVVDGFRVAGEDTMDAYQYFFDGEGNQTGYQPVGHFRWDPKPTHEHWHFKDFASYTLLREDQTLVARSKKEAFCLGTPISSTRPCPTPAGASRTTTSAPPAVSATPRRSARSSRPGGVTPTCSSGRASRSGSRACPTASTTSP
jgi:hypothetical protein